jgi:predicted DNA-binding protein (MmcQ/YjbR family)
MEYATLENHLLSCTESEKTFPFGEDVAVFKVCGKMFALLAQDEISQRITLKSDPSDALILRGQFSAIQAGYHMNKAHWNTVTIDETISEELLYEMINISYNLVVQGLKRLDRDRLT